MFLECYKNVLSLQQIDTSKYRYRVFECLSWLECWQDNGVVVLLFHQNNAEGITTIFKDAQKIITADADDFDLSTYLSNIFSYQKDKNEKNYSELDNFLRDFSADYKLILEWVFCYIIAPNSYADNEISDEYAYLQSRNLSNQDETQDLSFLEHSIFQNANIYKIPKNNLYLNLIYYSSRIVDNKAQETLLPQLYEHCFQEKYLVFLSFFRQMEDVIRKTEMEDFLNDNNIDWTGVNDTLLLRGNFTTNYTLKSSNDNDYSLPDYRNAFSHENTMNKRFKKKQRLLEENYSAIIDTLLYVIQELVATYLPIPPK